MRYHVHLFSHQPDSCQDNESSFRYLHYGNSRDPEPSVLGLSGKWGDFELHFHFSITIRQYMQKSCEQSGPVFSVG